MTVVQGRNLTSERKAEIQAMLDDGASWREIKRTLGADHSTMTRHFPGTQWTLKEGADLGVFVKKQDHLARKVWGEWLKTVREGGNE